MKNFHINTKLMGIMIGVSLFAGLITTSFLYVETVNKNGNHLKDMVLHLSRLIDSVVDFQKEHIISQHSNFEEDINDLVKRESLNQLKRAKGRLELQGDIEITLGYLEGDMVHWISQSYQEFKKYEPLLMGNEYGIPMQLALSKKTGIVKAKDYNGRLVLAAYTYIPSIGIGLVTKTYLSKIRIGFIQGASLAMIPGFVIVFFGVLIFKRLFNPIIKKLQDDKEEYRKLLAKMVLAQQEVEDSENRLKTFFDAAFEGIAITEGGKFVDGNDSFINMFGYKREEMLGMRVTNFVYSEDQDLVFKRIKENYTKPYEHRCVHKNGSIRYVEVQGKQIKYRDRSVRVTAINDITERKKAEDDLVKFNNYQKQVSKMEAIGSFAGGIVHDFNNALQPIIGNCDIILYEMRNGENCKIHHKNIMAIITAAEVAGLLVRRIQSFSHENTNTEMLIPLNLPNCIKESIDFLRSMIPKSIDMELNIEEELDLVEANDVTIKQVLMNLCKNASQAMYNEEGKIIIDVCNEEIIMERYGIPKGKYVRIEIEDNGKGMSSEVMDHVFDPYFTTKPEGEGTGIGLSVVDRIVRNYGGFIRLYSEVEIGTRIIIYIPAFLKNGGKIKKCTINKEEIPMGNGESILLVDDEEAIIEAVVKILESLNYKVTFFISSMKALREFQINSNKYDVVLTDLTMPEMTGIVLINAIKKIKPEIKIILCSGLGSNGKLGVDLYGKLVDVYIRKPITRKEYADALKKII
jgi:PAS domain S-box-containing protein